MKEYIQPKGFCEVLCIRDYKGFKKGTIYAQVGWNNGSHVIRANENGDIEELVCLDITTEKDGYNLCDCESGEDIPVFKRIEEVKTLQTCNP